jgi:hypothetical protein
VPGVQRQSRRLQLGGAAVLVLSMGHPGVSGAVAHPSPSLPSTERLLRRRQRPPAHDRHMRVRRCVWLVEEGREGLMRGPKMARERCQA